MNMTHGDILEAERNGLPEDEPEIVSCPSCEKMTYAENLRKCEKCGQQMCPHTDCNKVHVSAYGWNFCDIECAVEFMTEQIRELADENWRLNHANNRS